MNLHTRTLGRCPEGSEPPPFPRGWFAIAYADELRPRQVKALRYFGRELVLFRTDSGRARVVEATCPHLGAHLGDGDVVGESIRCPFHHLRFDGASGRCTHVPFLDRPGPGRVPPWPVQERSGLILVWHHEAGARPAWEAHTLPHERRRGWSPWSRQQWHIDALLQDVCENDVDITHFPTLHGFVRQLPRCEATEAGTCYQTRLTSRISLTGGVGPGRALMEVEQCKYGLGLNTSEQTIRLGPFTFRCRNIGCLTPVDDHTVHVRVQHSMVPLGPFSVAPLQQAIYNHRFAQTVKEDTPMWQKKRYLAAPALSVADGPIAEFRRWSLQFYAEDAAPRIFVGGRARATAGGDGLAVAS